MFDSKPVSASSSTVENACLRHLDECGMFAEDARKVMAAFKASELSQPLAGRWNDSAHGYPPMLMSMVLLSLDAVALEYIDANQPLAWYRPVFVHE